MIINVYSTLKQMVSARGEVQCVKILLSVLMLKYESSISNGSIRLVLSPANPVPQPPAILVVLHSGKDAGEIQGRIIIEPVVKISGASYALSQDVVVAHLQLI